MVTRMGATVEIRRCLRAPRPVRVPPMEVARRPPPAVVTHSIPVSLLSRVPGKRARYQPLLTTCRNCRASAAGYARQGFETLSPENPYRPARTSRPRP